MNSQKKKKKIPLLCACPFTTNTIICWKGALLSNSKALLIGARWEHQVALYFQLVTSVRELAGTWGALPRDEGEDCSGAGGKEDTGTSQTQQ